MYYVSRYEEYPIYEPAEGGYYYAGCELVHSAECETIEDALDVAWGFANDAELRQFNIGVEEAASDIDEFGSCCTAADYGRYIGETVFICIELEKGSEERGAHPYE